MSDEFAAMIRAGQDFFPKLAANNSKAWFEPHKAFYTAEIKAPAERMAQLVSEELAGLTGRPYVPKVFRIYRDVRFSKDKTPLNAHLHVSWSARDAPSWFWGLSPDYFILGMGHMGPDAGGLADLRARIDRDGAAIAETLSKMPHTRISDYGPAAAQTRAQALCGGSSPWRLAEAQGLFGSL